MGRNCLQVAVATDHRWKLVVNCHASLPLCLCMNAGVVCFNPLAMSAIGIGFYHTFYYTLIVKELRTPQWRCKASVFAVCGHAGIARVL